MFSLRVHPVLALLLLVACGGGSDSANDAGSGDDAASTIDAKVFMDAPPPQFDFSCAGNAAPTTADATVTVSGTVQQLSGFSLVAVDGATVTACDATMGSCAGPSSDGSATSDTQGAWSIADIATGGTPLDEDIEMTKTGLRTTYVYPAAPLTTSQGGVPILTFDSQSEGTLNALGCDTDQAIVGLAVTDCMDTPITDTSNINLIVKQNGTPVSGAHVQDIGSLLPAAKGTFLVCAVPANASTEVSATYKGMAFRAHNVRTVAGTTTATQLRPGF